MSKFYIWLALLPVGFACAGQFLPSAPSPIASAAPCPPLAFDQYSVNLRDVAPRPVIDAYFQFTNRSDTPVRVTKLVPSCGCLSPKLYLDKREYLPGERGRFTIGVKTAREQPGPKQYTTQIQYEANGKSFEETLVLRLVLPQRKLTIEPPEVYFYQLSGQADSRTVHIVDKPGGQVKVLSVESSASYVSATVGAAEKDVDGRHRIPILISAPAEVPEGRHVVIITVATDDADFPELKIPVLVQGATSSIVPVSGERVRVNSPVAGPVK